MKLHQALGIARGEMVVFVGAGGKTSALLRLGTELADLGWRVLATTTTRMAADEVQRIPSLLDVGGGVRPTAISRALSQHNFTFLYSHERADKVIGISPDQVDGLVDSVDSDIILVEADGARRLPFKAPLAHEPVIPSGATVFVPVVGFDVLGQPLDEEHVYNPAAMVEAFGFAAGERIKGPWVAAVVREDELGLKGAPPTSRIYPLINKVLPTVHQRGRARLMARLMLVNKRVNGVAIGAVQSPNPVYEVRKRIGAIVLAGGLSSRMGQPKVLMNWDNRPIINAICDKLRRARVEETIVVTGHRSSEVRAAVAKEGVMVTHNPQYARGDMLSSLQAGLRAMPPDAAAALVCLGDQPQLDVRLIYDVITNYCEGRGLIVAPSYQMRRGHPILIDRSLWPELLDLPIGAAPRDVINTHAAETAYVAYKDDSILRDIDTPDDYARERRLAGLS
jgi:molybdenum cofactor cytidylyltransferase